jgi:hypothetical protein
MGKKVLFSYAPGFHPIGGISEGKANVGPPLEHFAARIYIAGVLTHSPGDPPASD